MIPAIICDIDGTLALFGDANPYSRDFSKDQPNWPVVELVRHFYNTGYFVLLVSGREEKYKSVTENWLRTNHIAYTSIFMRPTKDYRPDREIKAELYARYIKGFYTVRLVIDDRPSVLPLWREIGLELCVVTPGLENVHEWLITVRGTETIRHRG